MEFYVGETVPKSYWSVKMQRVKESAPREYYMINNILESILEYANGLLRDAKAKGEVLSAAVVADKLRRRYVMGEQEGMSFRQYVDHFLSMKSKGQQDHVRPVLNRFLSVKPDFSWGDVNAIVMQRMIQDLNKGYAPTTVHKTVGIVREMINSAIEDKVFAGEVPKKWSVKYVQPDHIYLTTDMIKGMDMQKNSVKLWMLMYYTGCRYQNLKEVLDATSVYYVAGVKYLRYRQVKTKKFVSIPVLGALDAILNDGPWLISNQKLNDQIKDEANAAGIEKWDEVTCHTARRSCVTNLVLMGMPLHLVMRISGHGTEKELMRYVKYGDLVGAIKMADDENFRMFSEVIVA